MTVSCGRTASILGLLEIISVLLVQWRIYGAALKKPEGRVQMNPTLPEI
ncbi:hypothetical protein HMPREF0574_1718 [Mobiluncus curtisii subsp. curtisii ATCC 35241]|uniref:Uncharacterized protein n=2 Tax=Mobiluncus TaxID=2050 RepID=D6ZIS6_MOBCV|nr:hypothetical protein HMPREF0573_10306 [Mobiluncus curtisii ATCC 43063]EFL93117.1 hypothetical protein HMPREF0574_1718 [Mobiluncus curtisii subsp. curtisii ATCC 35241]EFU82838.1 hypothetical protein HMPREF0576_0168 [Mobiluncus holmesii ATCC 35242]